MIQLWLAEPQCDGPSDRAQYITALTVRLPWLPRPKLLTPTQRRSEAAEAQLKMT